MIIHFYRKSLIYKILSKNQKKIKIKILKEETRLK